MHMTCLSSTGPQFNKTINHANSSSTRTRVGGESNCFHRVLLSSDSSTAITYNEDQTTRSFLLPDESLTNPWTAHSTSRPIHTNATAIYPHFTLQNPLTTVLLQAHSNLPIRLINALDLSHTHASYIWTQPSTEKFLTPSSLAFTPDGTRFVAGGKDQLATFDLTRDGSTPLFETTTRPGSRAWRLYGQGGTVLSGLVSALALALTRSLTAAGTTGRQIGIWDAGGGEVCSFELEADLGGGITQLVWSACATYLFIAERMSDVVLVYDVRVGRRLGSLAGRRARTLQRMSFDVAGSDVWAGGTDGVVRRWDRVTCREGEMEPDASMQVSRDNVSSTIVVDQKRLLTASGQRFESLDDEHLHREPDNSMKLWQLDNNSPITHSRAFNDS